MNRWNRAALLEIGQKLFHKIYKTKSHSHPNHDIHFMARDTGWLSEGINSLVNGKYDPRCLKRYYSSDERVDQLHLSDRILQHVLLQVIKTTFKSVINPNCYHLAGPSGVRQATQHIRRILQQDKPSYFIRGDIKSFYRSISHYKLINDIKRHYKDPNLVAMLANIITNPIDTPNGIINPDFGIALRGPLSQFFSGLYLKPLDSAFDHMNVTYVRFQDDFLILCKTKRQLNRCRRRMMAVLHERGLSLSRKKSCLGAIESGFHFLGISYPPTQPEGNTNIIHEVDAVGIDPASGHYLFDRGGVVQLPLIKLMSKVVLCLTQGLYDGRANKLVAWSMMEFLSPRSSSIFVDGCVGG